MAPAILWPSQLYASSKKGISEHQPRRMLGVTNKIAWFMVHGIREAMAGDIKSSGPLGGEGKIVGADETWHRARGPRLPSPQRKGQARLKGKMKPKRAVIGLVERGGKSAWFTTSHQGRCARYPGAQCHCTSTLYT